MRKAYNHYDIHGGLIPIYTGSTSGEDLKLTLKEFVKFSQTLHNVLFEHDGVVQERYARSCILAKSYIDAIQEYNADEPDTDNIPSGECILKRIYKNLKELEWDSDESRQVANQWLEACKEILLSHNTEIEGFD